jgi:hypothetical protein
MARTLDQILAIFAKLESRGLARRVGTTEAGRPQFDDEAEVDAYPDRMFAIRDTNAETTTT